MEVTYPDSDDFDQERAKLLYERCAILVIEDLPENSEFGIDLTTFRTGFKFKGVKLIPPGIHFYYASAADKKNEQCGPRVGYYHDFKPKEILLKRWSRIEEDFDDTFKPDDEQIQRYSSNIMDLDRYLGAYRYSVYKSYCDLTSHVDFQSIVHLLPVGGKIRSVPYLVTTSDCLASTSDLTNQRRTLRCNDNEPSEDKLLQNLQPARDTLIKFTQIPQQHTELSSSMSPDIITNFYLDSTARMEYAFSGDEGRSRALAELQLSFLTLILGHVYGCFEQWRKLLMMITTADSALVKYPDFFVDFTKIIKHQLEHAPEDLFVDITDTDNLVRHQLDTFIQNCTQLEAPNDQLKLECEILQQFLESKFGWKFQLEAEDELPTIATSSSVAIG